MSKYQILVVEDDAPVRNLITTTLKARDYRFITTGTGEGAVMEAASHNPDIVLLDLGLPDLDGVEVIRRIRSWSNMPIIVIKPFSVDELLARLRVTQRRLGLMQNAGAEQAVYQNGLLRVDYSAGCAYLGEEELKLTPMEYKLLCLLARNTGKVLTHRFILQNVWGSSWENDIGSLRVFMAALRKKLESNTSSARYIQTHIGVGYRMQKID